MLQRTFLFSLIKLIEPLPRPSVEIRFVKHPVSPRHRQFHRFIRIEIQILFRNKVWIVRPQCTDIHTERLLFAYLFQPVLCTGDYVTITKRIFFYTILGIWRKSDSGNLTVTTSPYLCNIVILQKPVPVSHEVGFLPLLIPSLLRRIDPRTKPTVSRTFFCTDMPFSAEIHLISRFF